MHEHGTFLHLFRPLISLFRIVLFSHIIYCVCVCVYIYVYICMYIYLFGCTRSYLRHMGSSIFIVVCEPSVCEIFSWSMRALSCSIWDLVP